jgi:hypothetical protein
MTRTPHVRLGLVAIASVLATLVWIETGRSQPLPPGGIGNGPPGAIPGQPPGFGVPPAGFPNLPQPPAAGGIPTATWKCGRCGRVLAVGPTPPPGNIFCVVCGATTTFGAGVPQTPPNRQADPADVDPDLADQDDQFAARRPGFHVSVTTIAVVLIVLVGVAAVIVALVREYRPQPPPSWRRRRYRDDY